MGLLDQLSSSLAPQPSPYTLPAGLLGQPQPQQTGLLGNPLFQLGLSLLAAGGPQKTPHSFGQDLASAFGNARQIQNSNYEQQKMQADAQNAQIANAMAVRKYQFMSDPKALNDYLNGFMGTPGGGDQGQAPAPNAAPAPAAMPTGPAPTLRPTQTPGFSGSGLNLPGSAGLNIPGRTVAPNATDLQSAADQAAQAAGVPPEIFRSLIQTESGWKPDIKGPPITKLGGTRAIGLTQLLPSTAQGLGVDPNDPQQNLQGGAQYLAQMYKKFGNWRDALRAYNAGPANASMSPTISGGYADTILSRAQQQAQGAPETQVAGPGAPTTAPAPQQPTSPAQPPGAAGEPDYARMATAADMTGIPGLGDLYRSMAVEQYKNRSAPSVAGASAAATFPFQARLEQIKQEAMGNETRRNTLVDQVDPQTGATVKIPEEQYLANLKAQLQGLPGGGGAPSAASAPGGAPAAAPPSPSAAAGSPPVTSLGPARSEELKTIGAEGGTQLKEALDGGRKAEDMKTLILPMQSALDALQRYGQGTGPYTTALQHLRQTYLSFAQASGVKPDQKLLDIVSNSDVFAKNSTKFAFELVRSLGAREAASVVQIGLSAMPNLEMDTQGNAKVMALIHAGMQRQLDKRDFAVNYQRDHQSLIGLDADFNKTHPIETYVSPIAPIPLGSATDQHVDGARYVNKAGRVGIWNAKLNRYMPEPAQ